jgi:hypothetical protein
VFHSLDGGVVPGKGRQGGDVEERGSKLKWSCQRGELTSMAFVRILAAFLQSRTMAFLRESYLIFRNTALVTLAVVVGFAIGSALGIPGLLQAVCLVPAGYLFFRLSGEKPPGVGKVVGFLALVSGIGFLYRVVPPLVP